MEVSGQNGFNYDGEEKALKILLDTFGSAFSLEEIASAYQKASRNPDMAGEILCNMQRSSSTSTSHSCKEEARVEESSESSVDFSFEGSYQEGRNYRSLKPKVRPVSVGTVSSIIGKGYVRSTPSTNGSCRTTKPIKLDANVVPMSAIWGDDACKPNVSKHNQLHQDMEDFLFKMLGDGFQLDRSVIREVLDSCGYDLQKSMGKLLDESFKTLDKRTSAGDSSNRFTEVNPKSEVRSSEKFQTANYQRGERSRLPNKGADLHGQQRERDNLQKEVLTALFNADESSEESPRRTARDVKKFSPYGQAICEPLELEDSREDFKYDIKFSELEKVNEGADEEEYQNLRKAVKEYRATMNEYYKAAVDAFAKGEHAKAEKLLDQGHFFLKKAREVDEESNKMIVETRTTEAEEMVLDLHDHDAREAIRLLKCHLSSLSGIPSFEYLKVIIDASDQNTSKGSRRKLVMRLLEKESIQWTEGETAGTILIRLNSIERKRLSFLKK